MIEYTMTILLLAVVLACGIIDFKTGRIPNYLTFPLFFLGLTYQLIAGDPLATLNAFLIAFTIGFIAWIVGGMGGGDLKLLVALGVWVGNEPLLVIIIYGSVIGLVWGIAKMAKHGILKQQLLRFFRGIYLYKAMGLSGIVSKLPDYEEGQMPKNAVPYGSCLAIALFIFTIQDMIISRGGI